jgi:hypothetical protein
MMTIRTLRKRYLSRRVISQTKTTWILQTLHRAREALLLQTMSRRVMSRHFA